MTKKTLIIDENGSIVQKETLLFKIKRFLKKSLIISTIILAVIGIFSFALVIFSFVVSLLLVLFIISFVIKKTKKREHP